MLGRRRRRFGCRRREVAVMTTVSGLLLLLLLYTLALTWCLALPGWVLGDGDAAGDNPISLPLSARKLQFQPLEKADGPAMPVAPSSSSSSSSSASKRAKVEGNNGVPRHLRSLQFSHNLKDGNGAENTGLGADKQILRGRRARGGGVSNNGVLTMQQNVHKAPSSSSSSGNLDSSPTYVDERSEEEDGGLGASLGQEYPVGPGRIANNSSTNTSALTGRRHLPGAIIIGVKKAGTRALLEFLRIHPDVQAPGPEPHFFDRNYQRGLEWYRSLMPVTQPGQLTMEKTPSYFITREVPKRVQAMSRDVKLLVVVRDPVTRAISDYVQASSKRDGHMKRFEDMALLDQRLGIVNTSWGAIRIGVYTKHLERWFKYFPRSQIHFVSGEQLIEDPAQVLKDVQEFLGLRSFITEKHFYVNATRGFPCLVKNPEHHSKPHCLGKTKGRRHPEVDPHVIERLRDFYRPFNSKLYQVVGRDFGWS